MRRTTHRSGYSLIASLSALLPLLSASIAGGRAETAPPPAGGTTILEGATLIDGTGGRPRRDSAVAIEGGRIVAVGRRSSLGHLEGARVNLSGRYLVPGFIDMHAHVAVLPAGPDGRLVPQVDRAASERVLRLLLASGITTVRNPAAPADQGVALRRAVASGAVIGPRIFTAGEALDPPSQDLGAPAVGVGTETQVRAEVRRQAEAGVDFVKLYASLPPDLVRAAIQEAHARGLRVIGHLQATTWTEAARDGIDAITHGAPWSADYLPPDRRAAYRAFNGSVRGRIDWLDWVDPDGPEIAEMVREIAERGIPLDPTLVAYHTKFWGDDPIYLRSEDLALVPETILKTWRPGWLGWSPEDFRRARSLWPKVSRLVRLYHDRGVTLLAGSDLPNPWVVPGASFHRELALLVEAGLPPMEVLRIATANGARALGIGSEAGTIEPGKRADLVVLQADPLADIHNTRRIEWLMKEGVVYRPDELL